ncbi:MAG: TIR domain-containing protein [Acidobacteriota bacterium]
MSENNANPIAQHQYHLRHTFVHLTDQFNCVAYSPDGKYLASGSQDKSVRVWEAETGKPVRTLEGHAAGVRSVSWSPDGKYLASGSEDKTVRVWEADTGKLLGMEVHIGGVVSVSWSPDGKYLASGSDDKMVRIWEAESLKLLRTLEGHAAGVLNVSWSPNGKYLASGSDDKTVRVWEADSGKLLRTLEGHAAGVLSVSWSPDGEYLASGSEDKTVRMWEAKTGQEVQKYESPHLSHSFLNLAFCSVGKLASLFGQTVMGDPDILAGVLDMGMGGQATENVTSYVSAKIVLMGNSAVGKSALALRLVEDRFEDQVSTHGMRLWSLSPERLSDELVPPLGEEREVVIWDLGGQEEYRLVHQLFLHDTTMALILLDPTRDSCFDDVHEWNLGLEKRLKGRKAAKLLVGAKADQINQKMIDRLRVDQILGKCKMKGFHLTSAKADIGIAELLAAIAGLIDWDELSKTTRPRLFQRIRETIDELRRGGEILLLYATLEKIVQRIEPDEFSSAAVNTVVEQLARQGAITDTRLSTGERALVLQIGYVEIYAGSLIKIAREAAHAGSVPALELADAIFRKNFPGIEDKDRLTPMQERTVIECVIELMIEHGLSLKHERLLVFPTLFPESVASDDEKVKHTVSLYYDFSGAIDNIYSSLVAQLAASGKFGRVRLWKDRAEFDLAGQGVCGLQRMDRPGGWSHLDLLFGEKVSEETRDLFTVFVEEHLQKEGITIREVLEMDCQKCGYRFDEGAVRERIAQGNSDILCSICETRSPINEGAQRVRSGRPLVTNAIFALRKAIEEKKRRDIDEAKREMKSVRCFVSYSHQDESLRSSLDKHLSVLRREGIIETWHDRMISAGTEWKNELDGNLESARIVLLLVSADFIASDYCVDVEVRRALERHAAGEARVIPIILRPVNGWDKMPFGKLQALPELGKPITSWANQDEAFANVAAGIRKSVEELMRPSSDAQPQVLVTNSPAMPVVEPTPIRILHLSDLHFDRDTDPVVRLQPLVRDLKDRQGGLGFNELDYLVISGDLTNRASAEEFERAHEFISGLIERFELSAARLVIVPGNHDLNWDVNAYDWQPERKVAAAKLKEGSFIKQGNLYGLRDESEYPKRFENFARFYHQLTQYPYSLKPESQFRSLLFDELRVQFLELNSAFEIDEYFPERSGIQQSALANALLKANAQVETAKREKRIGQDASVFRIAVWHHPITGNEKIVSDAFVEQLRQEEFKLCLHGHVHEERADLVSYIHPRQIHVAGAGSFGAPMRQRPESTPRLYNVIEVARDHSRVRVHTRCLRKDGGAWEGWPVWPGSSEAEKRISYDIRFKE